MLKPTIALPKAHRPAEPDREATSRPRRLWEPGKHALCPVIGVCLSLDSLRSLARKLWVLQGDRSNHTLHGQLVTAAERRHLASETLKRELDKPFDLDVQQAAKAKCMGSLLSWWHVRAGQGSRAGPLRATLTHPRCEARLEMHELGQDRTLQHQVGAAQRVDVQRHRELLAEHRALMSEYAGAQRRMTRWAAERQRERTEWEAERVQARSRELALQSRLQQLAEHVEQWRAQVPQLPERLALQRRVSELLVRNRVLQGLLDRHSEATEPITAPSAQEVQAPVQASTPAPVALRAVVLCVGGRCGQAPIDRRAVEDCGAQFLHHDGGEEERLDPKLAAADLVICQTGCISHDAYWRIKEHCKRHGKRCLFVDTPSRSAIERALAESAPS